MQFCLVTREQAPFDGGDGGSYAADLAHVLAGVGEVTIVTDDARLEAAAGVHVDVVADVEHGDWISPDQRWSARVLDALERRYGDRGPDLLECADGGAAAFVALQAKRSDHRTLRDTPIAVRALGSWELQALLNRSLDRSHAARATCAIERYALRHADHLLWAGGDILGAYRRYYGADALAPATRIRQPLAPHADLAASGDEPPGEQLRLLYAGPLERRTGVLALVRALLRIPCDDWRLTIAGADSDTAPGGGSMRALLELACLGDPRVTITDAPGRAALGRTLVAHDVVVLPAPWDGWPAPALAAMRAGRPLLATPVGGLVELVEPGRTGWLAGGADVASLERALRSLLAAPEQGAAIRAGDAPQRRAAELTAPEPIAQAYAALARTARRPPSARRARRPLVSVVVPYRRMHAYVGDTLRSIRAQTYPAIETIVVADGPLDPADRLLAELDDAPATRVLYQSNRGLSGARNAGIAQARGRYVLPLDADNMAEPELVERAVALLEADRRLAYVTAWSRYVDDDGRDLDPAAPTGYHPLGNWTDLADDVNVAGDAAAVIPRRIFALGFRYHEEAPAIEDWMLYRQLRRAGRHGHVIPERLIRYRVRPTSMLQTSLDLVARLRNETDTMLTIDDIAWTSATS